MNFIKLILTVLGLIFGVMLFFWLFQKVERKALEAEKHSGLGSSYDVNMSWDDYERKYLKK